MCHSKSFKSPEGFFFLFKQIPFRNNKPKRQNDFTRKIIIKANCLLINCIPPTQILSFRVCLFVFYLSSSLQNINT